MDKANSDQNNVPISILIGLFSVPILWGTTYIVTRSLVTQYPVFITTALRHLIALIGFFPFFKRLKNTTWQKFKAAFITGGVNFIAIAFQTIGLMRTTSGKAGFITSLYIILIPVILWLIYGRKIEKKVIYAVLLSFTGLSLMMLQPTAINTEGENVPLISMGDIFLIICAILFAFQLIFTEKYVKIKNGNGNSLKESMINEKSDQFKFIKLDRTTNQQEFNTEPMDPILFIMLQMISIIFLSYIFSFVFQENISLNQISNKNWLKFIYLGILGTTFPFLFHNLGQKYLSSDKTGIIFSTEPIFATIFGILIDGEEINWNFIIGGAFIMFSIFLVLRKKKTKIQ